MSECWVVCDSAVLPHAAHRIHPVIGPHQGHSFPHLALVSQGRKANRKMGIPMLSSKWQQPSYACRTATSTIATWEGETFRLDALGSCLKPGRLIELKEVHCTREAYGPIMVLCCWAKGYQEPLYVVSNRATAEEACRLYEKRFRIETVFSDQKSRGFHIHKSHMSDVQRLSRLLIATCLAYIWIVY